jgi:hypothetical protein
MTSFIWQGLWKLPPYSFFCQIFLPANFPSRSRFALAYSLLFCSRGQISLRARSVIFLLLSGVFPFRCVHRSNFFLAPTSRSAKCRILLYWQIFFALASAWVRLISLSPQVQFFFASCRQRSNFLLARVRKYIVLHFARCHCLTGQILPPSSTQVRCISLSPRSDFSSREIFCALTSSWIRCRQQFSFSSRSWFPNFFCLVVATGPFFYARFSCKLPMFRLVRCIIRACFCSISL